MNFAAVFHRAQAPWSYALNADELVLRLQTGPEVERVFLHWGDPFEAGILGGAERPVVDCGDPPALQAVPLPF